MVVSSGGSDVFQRGADRVVRRNREDSRPPGMRSSGDRRQYPAGSNSDLRVGKHPSDGGAWSCDGDVGGDDRQSAAVGLADAGGMEGNATATGWASRSRPPAWGD